MVSSAKLTAFCMSINSWMRNGHISLRNCFTSLTTHCSSLWGLRSFHVRSQFQWHAQLGWLAGYRARIYLLILAPARGSKREHLRLQEHANHCTLLIRRQILDFSHHSATYLCISVHGSIHLSQPLTSLRSDERWLMFTTNGVSAHFTLLQNLCDQSKQHDLGPLAVQSAVCYKPDSG